MSGARLLFTLGVSLAPLLVASATSFGQELGAVSGIVVSSEDEAPLAGANVLLEGTVLGAASGTNGRFIVARIPEGKYRLLVSRVGFERKTVSDLIIKAGDTITVRVSLNSLPIQSEAVVVSASKREQGIEEIPVSVSVVDSKTLEVRNSITLDDALRYVPGVNMVQNQVNIRGMSGYSRGIGSRVLLLLDGLPLLTGDTGEITWETIPTLQVDRVEVVKGAGSALYGSSALGGVINVITKEAKEGRELRYRAYGGFYDSPYYNDWRWSEKTRSLNGFLASYSHRGGNDALILSGGRTNDDGFRENDFYHRWSGYGKFMHQFSPYENITLSLNVLNQRKGSFFWWKNLKNALQPDGTQGAYRTTTNRWNANFSYRKFVNEDFFFTTRGVYFSSSVRNDSTGTEGLPSRAHTGIVEFQGNYSIASSHVLTFGVVGNYDDIGSDLYGKHADFGGGIYAQQELNLSDQVRLTVGARYDYQKVAGLDAANQLSPKLGLVYSPDRETTLRLSSSRGFRAPSIGEIYIDAVTYAAIVTPNPSLRAEHSWSYEVGGSRLLADRFLIDGSLFWSDFSDLIEGRVTFDVDKNQPVIKFDNVTRARIQGAEISVKSDWLRKHLHVEASYTYVWPKDRTENQILRFRPRHLCYASATLSYKALSLGGDFRYISRVDRIDESIVVLAPIQNGRDRVPAKVVDARIALDLAAIGAPLVLRFNVNNLLQYNYVELIGNVAPIRNFVFSVESKF